MELDQLQIDFIQEIFNVSMGSAAAELNELTNQEIFLSVPKFQVTPLEAIVDIMKLDLGSEASSVSVKLEGALNGDGVLIYPGDNSLELARTMIDSELELDELTNLEAESISEISNIIIQNIAIRTSEFLNAPISSSLPVYHRDSVANILQYTEDSKTDLTMFVHMSFSIGEASIKGDILFLQDLASVTNFVTLANKVLDELNA